MVAGIMRFILLLIFAAVVAMGFATVAGAQESATGSFERVKTKTFDKEKFLFPEDIRGTQLNILFLAMGADREQGEAQQGALLDWQAALEERGVFSDAVMPYHFPVLAGVPFFVKGMIVGAMRESYEGKLPLDQCGVLFVKDLNAFAAAAGLTLDEQPTIVITSGDAKPLQSFKGKVSAGGVDAIVTAINQIRQ